MSFEEDKFKETQKKYRHTKKFKKAQKRYGESSKGRGVKKKYIKSEKGMQAQLRYYYSEKGIKSRELVKKRRALFLECTKFLAGNPGKKPRDFFTTLSAEDQMVLASKEEK